MPSSPPRSPGIVARWRIRVLGGVRAEGDEATIERFGGPLTGPGKFVATITLPA